VRLRQINLSFRLFPVLILPALLLGQQQGALTQTEEIFHGRRAWVLSNGSIQVMLLAGGGHIAEIRLLSEDPKRSINPLRIPHYQTIEPYQYKPERDDKVYGSTAHRWLSSGYMGHLLCFPIYGPPSREEAAAGWGNHGEAPIVEWHKEKTEVNAGSITFWYAADLPKTQFRVERAVHLARGARWVHVQEWVHNLYTFDRPINWMEHATFGPPFAEPGKTVLDASAVRGLVTEGVSNRGSLQGGSAIKWPHGTAIDGTPADLRIFRPKPHSGTYYALRLDPSRDEQFFTLYHPDFRVLIGYLFPSKRSPWLADWQENQSITELPWNGLAIARGLEFGDTPFAEGLRKSIERSALFDTPSYGWIGAQQKLRREYKIALFEIPEGFAGVKDLRTENGIPKLTPR
jgi:hypothetical protein